MYVFIYVQIGRIEEPLGILYQNSFIYNKYYFINRQLTVVIKKITQISKELCHNIVMIQFLFMIVPYITQFLCKVLSAYLRQPICKTVLLVETTDMEDLHYNWRTINAICSSK